MSTPPKIRPHLAWPLAYFSRTGTRTPPGFFKFQTTDILPQTGCVVVMLACLILFRGPALVSFENYFSNVFFRIRGPVSASTDIAVIEIDDESLHALGSWPWERRHMAKLIDILSGAGVKSILLDNLLRGASTLDQDAALAGAIQKSGRVYLPVVLDLRGYTPGWLENLPEFDASARGKGHLNHDEDSDGVLRRIQRSQKYEKTAYEYLAFRVARDTGRLAAPKTKYAVPLEPGGFFRINWSGPWRSSFPRYSARDLFQAASAEGTGRITPFLDNLKDKICLVGVTAYGQTNLVNTPFETGVPDLIATATTLSNLLSKTYVRKAGRALNGFCTVLIGFLSIFFFLKLTRLPFLIAGLLIAPLWVWISWMVFVRYGVLMATGKPVLLVFSVFIYCTAFAMINAERERIRLLQIATRDGLTGLNAIFYFRVLLNDAVLHAGRHKKPLSLILVDIDHFKNINDTYGHPAGDAVLKKTAKVLRSFIRHRRPIGTRDEIGRYGGEEFIILLRDCKLKDGFTRVAERVRKHVERNKTLYEGVKIPVTVSLGISTLHEGETVPDVMVRRADEALYRAKHEGRNRTCEEAPPGSEEPSGESRL